MANTQEAIASAIAQVPVLSRDEIKAKLRATAIAVLEDVKDANTKVEKIEVDKFVNKSGTTFVEITFSGSLEEKWQEHVTKRGLKTLVIKLSTPGYNVIIWKNTIAAGDRGSFAQDSTTCDIVNIISFQLGSKTGLLYDEGVKAFGYSVRYLKGADTPASPADSAPAKVYK